jgi:uncharacterized protein involved in exopolysaccharide biosynthesis
MQEDLSWILKTEFLKRAAGGSVVTALLLYIVTMPFMIKPLYESETIVYAPLTILSQQIQQQGIGFGNDREIDMYIQVLKSDVIADSLIKHFAKDTNSLEKRNRLTHLLQSRIKVEKTRYGSISIKVRDHDPKRAASMATYIVAVGEKIKERLLHRNREEAFNYDQSLFEQKTSEVSDLEKRYDSLMKSSSLLPKDNLLKEKTRQVYNMELTQLITLKNQFEQIKKDFDSPLPKAYIISSAVPATKAIWPNRWLFSGLGAVIFIFLIIVIEIIKRDIRS